MGCSANKRRATLGAVRKGLLRQGSQSPLICQTTSGFTPNRSERPCTTGTSWQEHLEKVLTWTKTLGRKVHFESYSQNKGTATKGLTWTWDCCILFCVLYSSLLNKPSVNRLFLLFTVPFPNYYSIIPCLKNKTVFRSQERGLSHLYGTSNTVTVSKTLLIFLQL